MKLRFASYTSNLLEQMYDFQKRIKFHQKWISNLQDLPQNRSLETVQACIVLQYYPHNNAVHIHMCDECKISIDSGVCHRLWSILVTDRASLFTEVFQNVPSFNISEQFESILVTILLQISILPQSWWSSMHGVDTL